MSKGSKKRRSAPHDAEGRQTAHGQIWIFMPEERRENDAQRRLRAAADRAAQDRGMLVKIRRTRHRVVMGGPDAHKRFDLVEPRDAGDLYAAVHRGPVLVLAVTASWVRSDPPEEPSRLRHIRRLEDFVRYKAAYGIARGPGDPKRIIESFATWPPDGPGATTADPRVLPLHVFDHVQAWTELDAPQGRTEFAAAYGPPQQRVDQPGRSWCPAPVGHGSDCLTVSGSALPRGFHWDVRRGRATDRLVTCHEVWKLDNHTSYANIYPDAYIRVGTRHGRRVWPGPDRRAGRSPKRST